VNRVQMSFEIVVQECQVGSVSMLLMSWFSWRPQFHLAFLTNFGNVQCSVI